MEQNKANSVAKTLTLTSKSGTFTAKDGKERAYTSYYVQIMGIEVKVEASDNTGKQLLESYFKGGNNG